MQFPKNFVSCNGTELCQILRKIATPLLFSPKLLPKVTMALLLSSLSSQSSASELFKKSVVGSRSWNVRAISFDEDFNTHLQRRTRISIEEQHLRLLQRNFHAIAEIYINFLFIFFFFFLQWNGSSLTIIPDKSKFYVYQTDWVGDSDEEMSQLRDFSLNFFFWILEFIT